MNGRMESLLNETVASPPTTLRARVLRATGVELSEGARPKRWRNLAIAAAAALLWLHVSWSAVLNTRLEVRSIDNDDLVLTARQLHTLVPEWSVQETRRLALVMQTGLETPLYQRPQAGVGNIISPR